MAVPPDSSSPRMQSSSRDLVNRGRAAMRVKDHRTPGSQTMNSSSTVAPGMATRRRAPTRAAAPSTVTFRTRGTTLAIAHDQRAQRTLLLAARSTRFWPQFESGRVRSTRSFAAPVPPWKRPYCRPLRRSGPGEEAAPKRRLGGQVSSTATRRFAPRPGHRQHLVLLQPAWLRLGRFASRRPHKGRRLNR